MGFRIGEDAAGWLEISLGLKEDMGGVIDP